MTAEPEPDHEAGLPRLTRERKTVAAMIRIYCRGHHDSKDGLCGECAALHDFAMCRLDRCPFGSEKPTCANCPIHCYKPEMRGRIREVMRYAGPKMLLRHPILALFHLVDGRKEAPDVGPRKRRPVEVESPTSRNSETT